MKVFIKYLVCFSMIGAVIGLMISLFFSYLAGTGQYYPSTPAFVNHFANQLNSFTASICLWMLIGCLFGFGSLIFNLKGWSLLKKTVVNFCLYYAGFLPLAIICGWFPVTLLSLIIFTLIFIVVYAIIWATNWFFAKNKRSFNK